MSSSLTHRPMLARLDRLAGRFASTLVRVGPGELDQALAGLLEQIAEALGADSSSLEDLSEAETSIVAANASRRPAGSVAAGARVVLPVSASGREICRLSFGRSDGGGPWPGEVVERLAPLADLVALAVERRRHMRELERARAELARLALPALDGRFDEASRPLEFEEIVGDSPALRVAIARVQEVAPTGASVVLFGETGTGKELFARAVHARSLRRNRPFVSVNCAALPPTLIESELFGHERGAFTGAVSMRQGRFELAHRGTVFLDEIGDLPPDVQVKLLRVLQEGEFQRVGSSQPRTVDVRVVAATHHDLDSAVKDGRFRADLYYRLAVFPIWLPPLRDRPEDIPQLVWYFVNKRQRALNRHFTNIRRSMLAALEQYSWPGNVRELENVVERAMIRSTGDTLLLDEGFGVRASIGSDPAREAGTLAAVERRHIEDVLRRSRWRINGPGNAAEQLGLHPNTLRFRMKKLGIRRPDASSSVVRRFRRA